MSPPLRRGARARMEALGVHAVVDDAQLALGNREMPQDFSAHHVRVADHRAQTRVLEHGLLRRAHVAVVRVERDRQALEGRCVPRAIREPLAVHAVARAVNARTRNALMRLHQREPGALPGRARRAREARVAPPAADVEGIHFQHPPGPGAPSPVHSRAIRVISAPSRCRAVTGALDVALRPAVRVVALAHQRKLHFSRRCAASNTRSS